jgi:hypothetical protein
MAEVATVNLLPVGMSPAVSMGMTYIAMANSISLAMENAVAAQQHGQVTGAAATTQVLALIIAAGAAGLAGG